MNTRIVIPVENEDGLEAPIAQHFGRAPFFAIVDLDDDGKVVSVKTKVNTGEHHGGTGQCMQHACMARLKGCRVIAVDLEDYKLELAEKYGAAFCVNAQREDAIKRVREITKRGSDVVVEAAGTMRTVEQTPFMVRKAGKVVLVGEQGLSELRGCQ